MRKIGSLIITVHTFVFILVGPQMTEWHGIVPLHSTRKDVEALFGPPPPPPSDGTHIYTLNEGRSIYRLDEGEVYIQYIRDDTLERFNCVGQIPIDTVSMIQITPKNKTRLSDLQVDENGFKRF